MTDKEIVCSQTITPPNTTSCLRFYCLSTGFTNNFVNKHFLFSPCFGIVVSGYSKTLSDKSLMKDLTNIINPYKKFKKMYKVDTTGEFGGKQELLSKLIISTEYNN